MKHAVKAYPRWTGHGGEFWQNMVHWRREWQTASVFLPWESQELYENCALDISNFLKEISSLSHSIVFLYFLHWLLRKAFLSLLALLWNSAFKWPYLSFSPLLFASLLVSAFFFPLPPFCKASSDSHFAFLHFLFKGMVLIPASCTVLHTSIHSSSGTLSIRSHPLNLFLTSTV